MSSDLFTKLEHLTGYFSFAGFVILFLAFLFWILLKTGVFKLKEARSQKSLTHLLKYAFVLGAISIIPGFALDLTEEPTAVGTTKVALNSSAEKSSQFVQSSPDSIRPNRTQTNSVSSNISSSEKSIPYATSEEQVSSVTPELIVQDRSEETSGQNHTLVYQQNLPSPSLDRPSSTLNQKTIDSSKSQQNRKITNRRDSSTVASRTNTIEPQSSKRIERQRIAKAKHSTTVASQTETKVRESSSITTNQIRTSKATPSPRVRNQRDIKTSSPSSRVASQTKPSQAEPPSKIRNSTKSTKVIATREIASQTKTTNKVATSKKTKQNIAEKSPQKGNKQIVSVAKAKNQSTKSNDSQRAATEEITSADTSSEIESNEEVVSQEEFIPEDEFRAEDESEGNVFNETQEVAEEGFSTEPTESSEESEAFEELYEEAPLLVAQADIPKKRTKAKRKSSKTHTITLQNDGDEDLLEELREKEDELSDRRRKINRLERQVASLMANNRRLSRSAEREVIDLTDVPPDQRVQKKREVMDRAWGEFFLFQKKNQQKGAQKKKGISFDLDDRTFNNLANAWASESQYERAIEYYEKDLTLLLRAKGEAHYDVAKIYNNLGSVWTDLAEYERAIDYFKKDLEVTSKIYDIQLGKTYNNMGIAYSGLGNPGRAIDFFDRSLIKALKQRGDEHPDVATAYNNLGNAYADLGEYAKALDFFEKDIAITKAVFGKEHPNIARTYNNIGNANAELKFSKKAIDYFGKSLKILNKIYKNQNREEFAVTFSNLGNGWSDLKNYKKAMSYYQKDLVISKKIYGNTHPGVGKAYNNIANAYEALKNNKKAYANIKVAYKILNVTLGSEHTDTIITANNKSRLEQKLGISKKKNRKL